MVSHSDGSAQVLWEDGERVVRRGWRPGDNGSRRAVLNVLPAAETSASLDRLYHEYQLRDELGAAWAARPLDLVRDAGRTMLVLEDVGGEPLDRLLGAPVEGERFLSIAIAIAEALGKTHQRGLVHKDIKPANILVNDTTGEVRLTGFGIASRLARERQSPHPPETIAGTLAYMAPEQTGRMNRSIDSRSDLYAVGVTFYQMLTGALPFTAADPMEWVHCHLARRPVAPAERLKEVPGTVSAIVMKLLAKRAEDRYQTASGLESDLRNCLTQWAAQRQIDDFPLGACDTPDRLLIAEKLYGRQREVETLLAAFNRVVNGGAPELVLVSGYSGVGKSSVVNELQPVLVPPRGLFASGKFDQYKRDIPYATLAQAFQSLARSLLGKSEEDLMSWRDALRDALGSNAGLIVDLVPEVKLIIGEPSPVPELPPQDAQRRFQMVFRQFIGVFARPEHPLALFLDDLQWLDAATLDLLEYLLTRSELQHLMLIGAYRDNEVTATHPLMRKVEAIKTAGGKVEEIALGPLAREHLGQLIAEAVRCESQVVAPLVQLVHEKTGGNPFFAIQFIASLADERLLIFDHEAASWFCDLDRIHAKGYTDNVVDLLIGKLVRVPAHTQTALQQLACLGNRVGITTLSIVLGTSEEQVHAALWEGLNQQLIERLDRSYKFVHDRVQEAAYALIPETSRAEAHLAIGRLLVAHTPPEKRDDLIFEIVNQFNRGAPLITSSQEREQLAELNLVAGKRAKASSAYASALTYLAAGAALLPEDAWKRRQELTFELELHPADCEICTGALEAAEERLSALAKRAVGIVQRCAVERRRVSLYTMLGAGGQAVAVALECLRHVGIDWSMHPSEEEARHEYERVWLLLGGRAIEDLVDLPLTQDPEALATLDMLVRLSLPAEYVDENLVALSICRAVKLSLERGNNDAAAVSYAAMSMIASARFGDHEKGYRLGKVACDLVERRGLDHVGGRVYSRFALAVPWIRPLAEVIEPTRRAFEMSKRSGEPTPASFASRELVSVLLALGHPLDQVEHEAEQGLEFVLPFGSFLDRMSAPLALIRMLRGRTAKFGSLDNGRFTERSFEECATGEPARAFLECYYWVLKLQARFFAGDFAAAVNAVDMVEWWYATSPPLSVGLLAKAEYHFYAALTRAALCQSTGSDAYERHQEALETHQRELRIWAANCPQNFEARSALVGAEIARIEGRPLDAMDLYERAIAFARANGFVPDEAIACEVAARFYAARDFKMIANAYLLEARSCYLRWGADGKVWQLDQLHPGLRQDERAPSPVGTIEAPVEQLDLATIIEVSQALSGEIVVEKLVDRFMRAAIEHAGAERAVLVAVRDEELRTSAEAAIHGNEVTVQMWQHPARDAVALPDSLIRYSMRTRDPVVLDDAMAQNPFSADPYIVTHHVRSVLSLPLINQGKLIGILYLENNLTSHVFTPGRVTVLKILASQAAISLENTGLYRALADSEAKIRRLVDANIIGIFVADLEGGVVEANDAFLRIIGYDRGDLVSGRVRWNELTPPEWRERDIRTVAELNSTGTVQPFEKEYIRKDGSRVPVLIGAALFKEGGSECVAFVLNLTERKRAEGALKKSETRYQNLFQAMAVSFFELDYTGSRKILRALKDSGVHDFRGHLKENPRLVRAIMRATRVVDVNNQTVASFGRGNKGELLTSVEEFWPDESLDDYVEAVLATIERNDKFTIETRVRRLDGTIFDARFTLRYTTEDKTRGLAGVIDITERKRAEEALRTSEYELRQIIDAVPGLIWSAGPDGKATYVSQRLLEYSGSRLEDHLKPRGWEAFVHPGDLPVFVKNYDRAIESGTPYRGALRLRCADGEFRWHDVIFEPLRDQRGRVIQWYGLSINVDEAKKAEEALRQSEQNLRSAIDGIPGLVGVLAPNGEVETVNRQILEYCGQSLEELKNWGTNGTIHHEDLPHVAEVFTRSIAAGIPYQIEQRLRRFDGDYRWFDNRGIPIRDGSGRITRWYVLLTDIEDRTRALARLQQMQSDFAHINRVSTMGELAASLAHEILHPIATARNNARAGMRFLEKTPPNLDEAMEALACVVRDADRAKDIVGRMRNHIRKAPPRKEHFDLNEAVNEVIAMVRSEIAKNRVGVNSHLVDGLVPVYGDRVQVQQVVVNLILNAVEAMASADAGERQLRVSTQQTEENYVLVAVRDSGPGIDPGHLERVFEAFYTTKTSGVGMGLSICQSIIAGHGGRLWAEPNEDRGAVFQFTLPTAHQES